MPQFGLPVRSHLSCGSLSHYIFPVNLPLVHDCLYITNQPPMSTWSFIFWDR